MTYYISAKRFYFEHKIKEGGYLAVEDSRFGDWTENVPEGAEVLDYSDYQIAPGLWILTFMDLRVMMSWIILRKVF